MPDGFQRVGEILLRLRRREESAAREAFSAAQSRVAEIRSRLARVRSALSAQGAAARAALLEGRSDTEVYRRWVAELRRASSLEAAHLSAAAEELEARRGALLEAMKQRKAMDCLARSQADREEASAARGAARAAEDEHAGYLARLAGAGAAEVPDAT
jgi:flagellar export protein FliJ